jgi:hypothetical protein
MKVVGESPPPGSKKKNEGNRKKIMAKWHRAASGSSSD